MLDECYDMELYNWAKADMADAVRFEAIPLSHRCTQRTQLHSGQLLPFCPGNPCQATC